MSFPESNNEIVAIGDLFKMTKGRSRIWSYRKFFLSGIYLTYVDEHGFIKGRVNINGCTIRRMTANECQNPFANFAFGLFTNRSNQRCLICATNEKERTLWISVLEDQIHEFQDSIRHYLFYKEIELGTSLVTKLSITSNEWNYRLVLTNLPRLLLIDPKSGVFKEQILFSSAEPPVIRVIDDLSFHIKYKAQEWRLSDIRGSSYWVGIFNDYSVHSLLMTVANSSNSTPTVSPTTTTTTTGERGDYLYQPKPRQPRVIGEVMMSQLPNEQIVRNIHMYHKYPEYIPQECIPVLNTTTINTPLMISSSLSTLLTLPTSTSGVAARASVILSIEEERRRNELLLDNLVKAQKMDGKIYGKNNNDDDNNMIINNHDKHHNNDSAGSNGSDNHTDENDDRWGDIEVVSAAGTNDDNRLQYSDIVALLLKKVLMNMKEIIVLLSTDLAGNELRSSQSLATTPALVAASHTSLSDSKRLESASLLFKTISLLNDTVHTMIKSCYHDDDDDDDGDGDGDKNVSIINTSKVALVFNVIDVMSVLAALINDTQDIINGIHVINNNTKSNATSIHNSTSTSSSNNVRSSSNIHNSANNNNSVRSSNNIHNSTSNNNIRSSNNIHNSTSNNNNIRSSSSPQRKLGQSRTIKNINSSVNRSNNHNSVLMMMTDKIYFLHVICHALSDISNRIELNPIITT